MGQFVRDGLRLEFRDGTIDRDVITEVVEWDGYRVRDLDLGPSPLVVDVGAHIGSFSALAADRWPSGRVLAFEVDDQNFALLERNVAGRPGVRAERCAIIGQRPPVAYRRNSANTGGHHLLWQPTADALPLPAAKTLADVLSEYSLDRIDFLKLDCEGAEHEIVRGAVADGAIIAVQRIGCEYHNFFGERGEALAETLRSVGFEVEARATNDLAGMIWAHR